LSQSREHARHGAAGTEASRQDHYQAGSLSLFGAVALGTSVMIGAGIFALTGQMAELSGGLFPLAFIAATVVVAFSAYSYVKMSNTWPSAGGIGMYLHKAYGNTATTAFHALLMYFSMVIAECFLARTFASYALQLTNVSNHEFWVPVLGVGLLLFAFAINLTGNRMISGAASVLSYTKIAGIAVFAVAGLWLSDFSIDRVPLNTQGASVDGFLAAAGLGILAFKGFTTITNSGSELVDPHRNVGRAIIISIAICVVVYFLVALAVAGNLSLERIVETKNYSLAEAARPALGGVGLWFTVVLAIVATLSGIIASIFAVSRMLAMLTTMGLVPHSHFGMPGTIQRHTLVYTVVLGIIITAFFDLTRIAALGIIFYLVMDIAIHWGIFKHLRKQVNANGAILLTAIAMDAVVLAAFCYRKLLTDPGVLGVAGVAMVSILLVETLFISHQYRSGVFGQASDESEQGHRNH
jgi:amino acid transporter